MNDCVAKLAAFPAVADGEFAARMAAFRDDKIAVVFGRFPAPQDDVFKSFFAPMARSIPSPKTRRKNKMRILCVKFLWDGVEGGRRWIAAAALEHGATVLSGDGHFSLVPMLKQL